MSDYKEGKEVSIEEEIVKKWIFEERNYVTACDSNGNENLNYFMQDCEIDAYAFALGVMKHKYKDVSKLYVPEIYGDEFYKIVNQWVETFKYEEKEENNGI